MSVALNLSDISTNGHADTSKLKSCKKKVVWNDTVVVSSFDVEKSLKKPQGTHLVHKPGEKKPSVVILEQIVRGKFFVRCPSNEKIMYSTDWVILEKKEWDLWKKEKYITEDEIG